MLSIRWSFVTLKKNKKIKKKTRQTTINGKKKNTEKKMNKIQNFEFFWKRKQTVVFKIWNHFFFSDKFSLDRRVIATNNMYCGL